MKSRNLLLLGAVLSFGASVTTSCGTTVSNEKLVIGMECAYAPFNWSETAENEYTIKVSNQANVWADGYDVQIAKILGQKLNKEVEIYAIEWESLITDLNSGSINAIIAGMTDTEERRDSISFTDEYYRSELVLIAPLSVASQYSEALTEEEFSNLVNGKKIESQVSTVTNSVIDTFVSEYGASHNTPVDTFATAAYDVTQGLADFMTAELPVANSIVASYPTDLGIIHFTQDILGEAQSELGVSIGIKKGNTELQEELNSALSEISQSQREELMQAAIERSAS